MAGRLKFGILTAAALVATLAVPAVAQAQDWTERAWVSVSGGMQFPSSSSLTDTFDIEAFVETGHATVKYPLESAPVFAGSFGVRVWKQLGVGIGVTHTSKSGNADVAASIPHPLYDNQFRDISGTTSVSHNETGVHVQLAALVPAGEHFRIILSGGPSYINVGQTIVTDVTYAQSYPYDTATFTGTTTKKGTKGAIGFNAGADVAWMFTHNVGVGGMVQFSRATVKLDAGTGRTISLDAGGAQVGAGLRLVF